ncbi:hypothetical protein SDC9_202089 [bioreactor metagenome]|uniref:Uncharacterized protein n=1 Tax=bioreactor metagenome TaxID=1076179 RepID=A0A645IVH0_9ZZZZ
MIELFLLREGLCGRNPVPPGKFTAVVFPEPDGNSNQKGFGVVACVYFVANLQGFEEGILI